MDFINAKDLYDLGYEKQKNTTEYLDKIKINSIEEIKDYLEYRASTYKNETDFYYSLCIMNKGNNYSVVMIDGDIYIKEIPDDELMENIKYSYCSKMIAIYKLEENYLVPLKY